MTNQTRLEAAVLNNVGWYQAMFAAHGLAGGIDSGVWSSPDLAPPFHSNLVVLSASATLASLQPLLLDIGQGQPPGGWSVKDSFACLDLGPLGFTELFAAEWIWRDPSQGSGCTGGMTAQTLDWNRITTPSELAEWEAAWWGDVRNASPTRRPRQFPDSMLANPDLAFFAGRPGGQTGGQLGGNVGAKIITGGIANRSPGAVGLSNLFSPEPFVQGAWAALVAGISGVFPGQPIVGYERGDDLARAHQAGFESVGALRVWKLTVE